MQSAPHRTHHPKMDRGDLTHARGMQPNAAKIHLIVQIGGIRQPTAKVVDHFTHRHVENALAGIIEKTEESGDVGAKLRASPPPSMTAAASGRTERKSTSPSSSPAQGSQSDPVGPM
jgi:hypothetical protein